VLNLQPKRGLKMVLSLDVRKRIQECFDSGLSVKQSSEKLGICPSTLHRERKKCTGRYSAEEADRNTSKGFHPIDDICGKKFFLLTVLEMAGYSNSKIRRTMWKCSCECGAIAYVSKKMLAEYCSQRRPLSCGCVPKQWKNKEERLPIEELAHRKYQDLIKFREISGECWEWTGYYQKKGNTPKTSWRNKSMTVRKCMYLVINGLEEVSGSVFTTCGTLRCFNPKHLTLDVPRKRHLWRDQ
jgi:hypothetical protein